MRHPLPLACLAVLLACAPAAAQTAPAPDSPVKPGMRIRVHGPSTGKPRWVGRVTSVSGDTVLVNLRERGRRSFLLSAGDTIEVSRGRGNRPGGAWFGLFAGTFVGGAVGVLLGAGSSDGDGLPGEIGGGVSGAVIGAVVGSSYLGSRGFERWTRVRPAPQSGAAGDPADASASPA